MERTSLITRLASNERILGISEFVEATPKDAGDVYGCRMLMQSAGIDLSAVIAAACLNLGIEENQLARRFYVDRSSISRATQRVKRDPELPAATKKIQRKPEKKSTLKHVPFIPPRSLRINQSVSSRAVR